MSATDKFVNGFLLGDRIRRGQERRDPLQEARRNDFEACVELMRDIFRGDDTDENMEAFTRSVEIAVTRSKRRFDALEKELVVSGPGCELIDPEYDEGGYDGQGH